MSELIKFKFGADASQFTQELATMQTDLDKFLRGAAGALTAMGLDSLFNNVARIKSLVADLFSNFTAFLNEAEKIEDVGTRLGVMLGGDAGGGETLAHRRMVLGVSVGLSEAAEHRATFIQSLMMRGMNRPNCITSDDHKGIRKALAETLTGVP